MGENKRRNEELSKKSPERRKPKAKFLVALGYAAREPMAVRSFFC
jgi:hypothetical protein